MTNVPLSIKKNKFMVVSDYLHDLYYNKHFHLTKLILDK
ncbi:hypothetical protein P791_1079 [Enterococcus faecalis NY9]|nr:hypothetical protein P791_1079 [Enterococcus faecalis NY9]